MVLRRQFLGAGLAAAVPAAVDRPNILLILTDDMSSHALGCYGNTRVRTPNLDRLATTGIRFTNAYATPQCTPTRATLLSGQYTARHGMWHVIPWYGLPWASVAEPAFREQFPRDQFTLAKGLRSAGYATACFGKWHLTTSADGNYNSLAPAAAAHYGFDESSVAVPKEAMAHDRGVTLLTDRAAAFIEAHPKQPWFCYLAHHATHRVLAAPPELTARYRREGHPESGLGNAVAMASMEHLDAEIGRLLARIDALGQRGRTLVVFVSDNGGVTDIYDPKPQRSADGSWRLNKLPGDMASRPFRAGKGSAYEGGLRVPMIVHWPGAAAAPRVEDEPVHVVDLLPTLLAAAGTRAPAEYAVDGANLLPLWQRRQKPAARALYWHMPLYDLRWAATPSAVIRVGDWKLIDYFGDAFDYSADGATYRTGARLELFNLHRDPGEQHNLADADPRRAARMQKQLRAWIAASGAAIPGVNPRHEATRQFEETRVKPGP